MVMNPRKVVTGCTAWIILFLRVGVVVSSSAVIWWVLAGNIRLRRVPLGRCLIAVVVWVHFPCSRKYIREGESMAVQQCAEYIVSGGYAGQRRNGAKPHIVLYARCDPSTAALP